MTLYDICLEILTGLWLAAGTLWALAAIRLWLHRAVVIKRPAEYRRTGWQHWSYGMAFSGAAIVGFLAPAHILVYNNVSTHLHSFILEGIGIVLLNLSAFILLTGLDESMGRGRSGLPFYVATTLVSALLGAALAAL